VLYDANERGQNHQHVVSLGRLLHANVFSSSVALVLIFPNPGPSTVAASHSGKSMFAVDAATSVTISYICNCETEVVPLQTLHPMLPPPPPPPSFAPTRLRWCPFNIHMQCCPRRHHLPQRQLDVCGRRCHLRDHFFYLQLRDGGGAASNFALNAATSATTSLVCTYETGVVSLQHSHATLPPPLPAPPSHPTERWSTSIRSHVSGTVQLICCSQLSKDFIDNICTLNTL